MDTTTIAILTPIVMGGSAYLGARLGAVTEREKNQQTQTRWEAERKAADLTEARALAEAVLTQIDAVLRLTPAAADPRGYRPEAMTKLNESVNRLTVVGPVKLMIAAEAMQMLLQNPNAPAAEFQKGRDRVVAEIRAFTEAPD